MIKLKNINLEGITMQQQIQKIYEEVDEFVQAIIKGDATNAIEEYFDVVQSGLGALQKMGLSADYVMRQYPKHEEKLKDRPRNKELGACNCAGCGKTLSPGEKCDCNHKIIRDNVAYTREKLERADVQDHICCGEPPW